MLPKPDKSKKTKTEQLDLVETISKQDNLLHRRRFIIFTLVLTAGISLIFWGYRFLITTPIGQISLPHINFFQNHPSVALNLPSHFSHWSIYVKSNDFVWSQNSHQDPESEFQHLRQLPSRSDSLLRQVLPSGVDVKEILATSSASYLISVPNREIFLSFGFPASEQSLLPQLVDKIYWAIIHL